MSNVTEGARRARAFDEAWARLSEAQRERVARADTWRLVHRRGRWVIQLPRRLVTGCNKTCRQILT